LRIIIGYSYAKSPFELELELEDKKHCPLSRRWSPPLRSRSLWTDAHHTRRCLHQARDIVIGRADHERDPDHGDENAKHEPDYALESAARGVLRPPPDDALTRCWGQAGAGWGLREKLNQKSISLELVHSVLQRYTSGQAPLAAAAAVATTSRHP
jgi:hypothetical protein